MAYAKKCRLDSIGPPISVLKLDKEKVYNNTSNLLQKVINEESISAWQELCEKIDYLYYNLNTGLINLDKETNFIEKIKNEVSLGKKLLFKHNLVKPIFIDIYTHAGDFYGGWGFYFARKYLLERHDESHEDNPMNGYNESIYGIYIPHGYGSLNEEKVPNVVETLDKSKIFTAEFNCSWKV